MRFKIKVKKPSGEIVEVFEDAPDRYSAARGARKDGAIVISAQSTEDEVKNVSFSMPKMFRRISLHERIVFAQNLSAMITAGLSLARALVILERQTKNDRFKEIVGKLKTTIDEGGSLSDGLALYPDVFNSVFVAMVASGEESGMLPGSLKIVGDQLSKSYALKKKITSALVYPGIIFLAMIGIAIFMMINVVPSLTASFAEFNAQLPLSTRFVIALSDFFANHTLLSFFVIALFGGGVIWMLRTARGGRVIDYVTLRLPKIADLVRQANCATFARTLSSLISAGVEVVEAITITARVVPNTYYMESLTAAAQTIEKGLPLSDTLKQNLRLYPVLLGAMVEVGEETGTLPLMLMNTAVFYEDEVDSVTKNLSTIIEPILMIVIGCAVGFFAVSMISPLYSLTSSV